MKKKILKSLSVVLVFSGLIFLASSKIDFKEKKIDSVFFVPDEDNLVLRIANTNIDVLLALDEEKRVLGLGFKENLDENSGMFFVFEHKDYYGIWMKDMLFPIDILWIDEAGKIVHIEENISPETYPKIFYPKEKARYVLEVNAGFVEKNTILIGEMVGFN